MRRARGVADTLGCEDQAEFLQVKRALHYLLYAAYHVHLEKQLLAVQCAGVLPKEASPLRVRYAAHVS